MINEALKKDLEYTYGKLTESEKKKLSNSSILITGAAGFLGFYYAHFFYHYKEKLALKKVVCLDNFMLGKPSWLEEIGKDDCFDVEKFDIIKDDISNILGAENIDYVIHMASIASPIFYRKYPIETLDANIWGLRRLLDYYSEKDIKGFLFFSSSEIYGNPAIENVPTDEEYHGDVSCTGPRACYDESKRFGETMCMLFAKKYDMPIGIARPFNNYGPGMKLNDKRVPADFANDVLNNNNIVILSNGAPKRTFCYIADAIAGYLKILLYGRYEYFNIGIDEPEISIIELAKIYRDLGQEILGYTGEIEYSVSDDKEYLTNNPQRRCPRIDKAKKLLGYEPDIDVHEGIRRFLNFIKESDKENLLW